MKKYTIAASAACVVLLGLTITGTVYYHNLQSAKAEAATAITQNTKAVSTLHDSIRNATTTAGYQNNDILANDAKLVPVMTKSYHAANADYRSVKHVKTPDSMDIRKINDFITATTNDTRKKNEEAEKLNKMEHRMTASHTQRLIVNEKSALQAVIDNARKQLDASNGNVDNNDSRNALNQVIATALKTMGTNDVNAMKTKEASLNTNVHAVQASVQARNARIEAEREAAAQAASQAAQQQAASNGSYYGGGSAYRGNSGSTYGGGYRGGVARGGQSSGGSGMININAPSSCNAMTSSDYCQSYVDRGGFTNISYYGGASNIFAAHNNMGGSTVLGWQTGQKVSINGRTYTVTDRRNNVAASDVPTTGTYAQTCNAAGQRVLVGLR